jgi:hypothetical protein
LSAFLVIIISVVLYKTSDGIVVLSGFKKEDASIEMNKHFIIGIRLALSFSSNSFKASNAFWGRFGIVNDPRIVVIEHEFVVMKSIMRFLFPNIISILKRFFIFLVARKAVD